MDKKNVQLSTDKLTEFNKDLGLLANYDYSTTPEELEKYIQNDIQGSDILVKNNLETIFYENTNSYIESSFNSLMLNNLRNLNTFVKDNLNASEKEMSQKYNRIKNQISKSRINSLENQWMLNYYRFVRFLFIITSVCLLCLYINLYAFKFLSLPTALFVISVLIIVLLYFGILITSLNRKNKRREDDWNKLIFEWKPHE